MNPMTNYRPGHAITRAIIFVVCLAAFLSLFGCTNNAMRTPEPIAEPLVDLNGMITVTHREFITLRTGQICEVKKQKIVACERNTFRYAESKADLRQMKAIAGEENED
jgi:hypothetical protein